ncbi:cyclin dependent kinase [Volvox carteri f. nagariensis]|uniref:cyclin-dependent kinase n=1 Tax=Volvox carteri f. nagariensis TaxID=3068 RepID=D8U6Z7_VOLCA|nr:cyclin dependent kinase [Volvox carteri f. nagariensis]EFJ44600.1 cyclin dependent kinase [Volvox carteri f. nagariensis]|eukprot:XP_002954450.1 cyclin dependent kinase [Volvox carteri f. nagariensis]
MAQLVSTTANTPLTRIEMPSSNSGDDVFGGTRSIHSAYVFSVDKQIGEGTYGQVFMGHDRKTNDKVALKKIRMDTEKEGFPITAIREIKILSTLSHPNVVNLREIVRSEIHKNNNFKGSIYMVFDYAEYDLTGLMESTKYVFTEPQVKCILKQLLKGLAYCHNNGVLHRDLKASNILIDTKGTVKLADFGLARPYNAENEAGFTNRVITLWYRPPELLLGAVKYGGEVDMWSVGCIFAELLTGKPLFPGKDDMDQMDKIFQIMGGPTEQNWPGVTSLNLKLYKNVPVDKYPRQHRLREMLRSKGVGRHISDDAIRLLEKMLCLDPKRRISAADAVMDPYLWMDPMPCEPQQLPCRGSGHEFTMKKRRNDQHREQQQQVGPPMPLPPVPGYAAGASAHHGYGPGAGPDPKRPRQDGGGRGGPSGGYTGSGGGGGGGGGMGPPQQMGGSGHHSHGVGSGQSYQGTHQGMQMGGGGGSGGPGGYRGGPAGGQQGGGYGVGGSRGTQQGQSQGWQQQKR